MENKRHSADLASILVVVDSSLRRDENECIAVYFFASILVVVDSSLRRVQKTGCERADIASILVVVDSSLRLELAYRWQTV